MREYLNRIVTFIEFRIQNFTRMIANHLPYGPTSNLPRWSYSYTKGSTRAFCTINNKKEKTQTQHNIHN